MLKQNKKRIISLVIALIIVFAALFYRFNIYYPDITLKVTALYDEHPNVVECDDEYFILSDGKITNADTKEVIYSGTDENSFLKSYNDLIWIFDGSCNEKLKAIDKDGNVKKHYLFPGDSIDFLINDDVIFDLTFDELIMYRLKDDTHLEKKEIDYSFVFHSDDNRFDMYKYSCEYGDCLYFKMNDDICKNSFYCIDTTNNEWIGNCKYNSISLLSFNKEHIFYEFNPTNLRSISEYSFSNNKESIHKIDFNHYVNGFFPKTPLYSDESNFVLVSQELTSRIIGKQPPIQYSDEMEKHDHDYAVIINKNDFEVKEKKTKTFERILYVDSEKAITYYKGKYLTYSLDGWKVTNKQSASEIKEGGSYNFVTCGDYIFVFDKNYSKLLNRIEI